MAIENLLVSHGNGGGYQLQSSGEYFIPQLIKDTYAKDLDFSHLKNQLRTLPDLIHVTNGNVSSLRDKSHKSQLREASHDAS